jgi:hypothetical protein
MTPYEAAYAIAARLTDRGHVAYFAGGCVRDTLLALEPTDYDIATSANPDEIRAVFRSARGVGESFGVMLVRIGGRTVEVATFRSEGAYNDGRRPSTVDFSDARQDALRRDFSINGLFQDPRTGEVIDHVGGRADLEKRILRAIEDPERRMEDDRLRTLRAARFAARYSLKVDEATERAVIRYAGDLKGVSRERIGGEVRRMLEHTTRGRAVELVERWGLDVACLGEPHSVGALDAITALPPGIAYCASLAAWRLDRNARQPPAGTGPWAHTLVLSNREQEDLADVLELVDALETKWTTLSVSARKRLAARRTAGEAIAVVTARQLGMGARISADIAQLRESPGGIAPAAFVTGADLIALGERPGPKFKFLLDEVYDSQLEGLVLNREEALDEARRRIANAKN